MLPRTVGAEALDHLPVTDPAARRSRRDLARVHRAMATRAIVARAWQRLVPQRRLREPLRVLELGAGDGTLLLGVARALAPDWPRVQLTLLDRQQLVSAATLDGYARLGWTVRVMAKDVLDWAALPGAADASSSAERWDLISTSLFLHHFQGSALDSVLGAVAARADRFFACEPRRAWLALAGSHLVGALGANAVTRQDAVLSVQAGFRGQEISALWPSPAAAWLCEERAAGLFSHCFSARRGAVAR
jgi:SAM-dependent methyltransferase